VRIAHVITTIERGGAENQLLILCREQVSLGYDIWVIYLKGRPELLDDFRNLGVKVQLLQGFMLLSPIYQLRKLAHVHKFDLLHAHLPQSELVASLAFTRVPIVISRHNSEKFYPRGPALVSRAMSLFCLSRATSRIAISESVLRHITIHHERARSHCFHVVYYGFQFDDLPLRPSSKLMNEKVRILSIGRLVAQKDFATFLHGLFNLKQHNMKFHASIIGAGNLEKELKSLTHQLDLNDEVSWKGRTKNTNGFYSNSDIFVLTSLYEGFGLVLVEAMNFDLPIVCSRFSAALEVLGENYSGFFEIGDAKELSDKIEWSIYNRNLLVNQLRNRRKLFDCHGMAKQVDDIYKNTIS
jgi:glycosyltransferase involved in cell wall biosynthesis